MTNGTTPPAATSEVDEGKALAAIGYLGILFLIPLLAKKDNKFCQHHGKQGAVLFGFEIVGIIVLVVLGIILNLVHLSCVGGIVMTILWLAFWIVSVVLALWGLIMAFKGVYWKMPVLGGIAEKLKF